MWGIWHVAPTRSCFVCSISMSDIPASMNVDKYLLYGSCLTIEPKHEGQGLSLLHF